MVTWGYRWPRLTVVSGRGGPLAQRCCGGGGVGRWVGRRSSGCFFFSSPSNHPFLGVEEKRGAVKLERVSDM